MNKKTQRTFPHSKSPAEERFEKSINMIVRAALEKLKEPGSILSLVIKEAMMEARKLK